MQKLVVMLAAMVVFSVACNAQFGDILDKAKSVATITGFDVNKIETGIMIKLAPALALTNDQKPKVATIVTHFLNEKAKIVPLLASNKAAYTTKQSSLFATLTTKLTGVLLKNQMNKFVGLRPETNTPSNPLSQLFY